MKSSMKNAITTAVLAALLALPLLTGCDKEKAAGIPAAPETPTAPTAPDKPAVPDAPSVSAEAASGGTASASVGTDAIEAKAGDVSVKLPN
jgi:hypothetical protein